MYSSSCGKEMNEGEPFDPNCGAAVDSSAEVAVSPMLPHVDTTPILVQGILSLAFANTLVLSWVGIIFGVMTKKKVKFYLDQSYELTGKARVGQILAKVGTISGIVGTVCWAICWVLCLVYLAYLVFLVLLVYIFAH